MFKKIVGIALAAMLVGSTAVVAASAAETDEAVAAADASAVAAADDSSVAAADDSGSTGDGNKIYFDANSAGWNATYITVYIYDHNGDALIPWGANKGRMKDEGDGKWSFDLDAKGISLSSTTGCIFTADWGLQTCDIIAPPDAIGATASCTGEELENNVDSTKKSKKIAWSNGAGGVPKCITSIGNVIGDVYWEGETGYSMFVNFLKSTGADGIDNAKKYTGKPDQQVIDDTAGALGLSQDEITKAITESGRTFEWKGSGGGTETTTSASGGGSSSGGSSSGGSSSGSSGSSSSGSSSSGSSTTTTVTSGEGDTVYFVIGGVMLAALGVFFLARKKREY